MQKTAPPFTGKCGYKKIKYDHLNLYSKYCKDKYVL